MNYIAKITFILVFLFYIIQGTFAYNITFSTNHTQNNFQTMPYSENRFIIAWCDDSALKLYFQPFYLNGTAVSTKTEITSTLSDCYNSFFSIDTFNEKEIIALWTYQQTSPNPDITYFKTYYVNGTNSSAEITLRSKSESLLSTSVTTLSNETFIFTYANRTGATGSGYNEGYFKNGTLYSSTSTAIPYDYLNLKTIALDERTYVNQYWSYPEHLIGFQVFDINGTNTTQHINIITTGLDLTTDASIAAFDNKDFVIGISSASNPSNISFVVYNKTGNQLVSETFLTNSNSDVMKSVSVTILNSTAFVISFLNQTQNYFAIYNKSGSVIVPYKYFSNNDATINSVKYSRNIRTNIELFNDSFIFLTEPVSGTYNFTLLGIDGKEWTGVINEGLTISSVSFSASQYCPTPNDAGESSIINITIHLTNTGVTKITGDLTLHIHDEYGGSNPFFNTVIQNISLNGGEDNNYYINFTHNGTYEQQITAEGTFNYYELSKTLLSSTSWLSTYGQLTASPPTLTVASDGSRSNLSSTITAWSTNGCFNDTIYLNVTGDSPATTTFTINNLTITPLTINTTQANITNIIIPQSTTAAIHLWRTANHSNYTSLFGFASTDITLYISPSAKPTLFYDEETPVSGTGYYVGRIYYFNISVYDINGISNLDKIIFEWNGTTNETASTYTDINTTVREYQISKGSLSTGNYTLKWYGNDSNGNLANIVSKSYIIDITDPAPGMTANVTSPINYNTGSNYQVSENNTGDGGCTYILYRNGTNIGTGSAVSDTTTLSAAAYNYTYATTGCANYSAGYITNYLTVSKISPTLTIYLNGSTSNRTTFLNENINVTGTGSVSSLTYKLYNLTHDIGSGTRVENISKVTSVGLNKITYNTSGNENYTATSVDRYIIVFDINPQSILQTTSLSSITENTEYSIISKVPININNTGGSTLAVNYTYNIPATFLSPASVSLIDSAGNILSYSKTGNAVSWESESITTNIIKTENISWTCTNCLNYTSTVNEYSSAIYNKTLNISSLISNYIVNISSLYIELPNTFIAADYNVSIKENGTEISTLTRVTKVASGEFYDYILISDCNITSETIYDIFIQQGGTTTVGLTTGSGGGSSSGESGVRFSGNFSFLIDPTQIATCSGLFCTEPQLTPIEPYNKFTAPIRVCNYETRTDKIFFPQWYWTCEKGANCFADWCTVKNNYNESTGIEPMNCGYITLTCTVPKNAKTDLNKTANNLNANIYTASFLVYPDGYSKNTAKTSSIMVEIFAQPQRGVLTGSFALPSADVLKKVFICFSTACKGNTVFYIPLSLKIFNHQITQLTIQGLIILITTLIIIIGIILWILFHL